MKNSTYSALLTFLCLAPLSLHAQTLPTNFSATLDAGLLKGSSSAPMKIDNTLGSANGSLLLLFDLGSSKTASNTLTAGQFVSGTNTVLAAAGFNTLGDIVGGTNETLSFFDVSSATAQPGDEIALRWFPQITLAQYQANPGAVTTAGEYFGTYNPSGLAPDGGSNWTVPSGGQIALQFYTTDSNGGGTQAPSEGIASSQVQGLVVAPEPSTYALFGLGALGLLIARRRLAKVSVA